MLQNRKYNDSSHRTIVQDCPQETEIPRKQSEENKGYVPVEGNHLPRIPQHSKWMTGRSAVTLHR